MVILRKPYAKVEKYDDYIEKFKEISSQLGRPVKYRELINNEWGLPSTRWFVAHCPDENVKNFSNFLEWLGYIPRYHMSKEGVTELIYKKQKELKRDLMASDFSDVQDDPDNISNSVISKYWGNFNNMKKALGLNIVQESMKDRTRSIDELKDDLIKLCNEIYNNENRKLISLEDIGECDYTLSYQTYEKHLKSNNSSIRDFLKSIGFNLVKPGDGLVYEFEDGEITESSFELKFTKMLRNAGFKYDETYFRTIRYRDIDNKNEYDGLLNCDYKIIHNEELIYVEVAGMLRDYKDWYYKSRPITCSKSKERYRIKLRQKEEILKNNELNYYFIFPNDLEDENILEKVLNEGR